MKASFLISNMSGGGAARAVSSLANELNNRGYEISIVKFDNMSSFYNLNKEIDVISLNIKNDKPKIISHFLRMQKIRQLYNNMKVDIIICMSITMLYSALISLIGKNIKLIGTERSNPYQSLSKTVKPIAKKFLSLLADGFIFQTEESSNFYPEKVRKNGIVIQNAVYDQDIYDLPIPVIRENRIISVGRLIESKGFDVLIKAFAEVHKKFPNHTLEIYGDGPLRAQLQSLIDSMGLHNVIYLRKQITKLSQRIYNSSIFVFTSRHEGMPNALIEALACGLPCVSTKCKMGPEELINDGENGFLVEVDDIEGIADKIILLLENSDISNKIGKNALKIRETNSIENVTQKHLEYFNDVLYGK